MSKMKRVLRIGVPLLLIALVVSTYVLGYRHGSEQTFRAAAAGGLATTAHMHWALEQGEMEKLRSTLEISMLTYLRKYQELCPHEACYE